MTRGVNPPESWGKGHSPPPAIPLYERLCEFRQTLLETLTTPDDLLSYVAMASPGAASG